MPALLQLAEVRIELRVVRVLMMAEMLQAIFVRGGENGKHAEPFRSELIQQATSKQHVVSGLVPERREPMLPGAGAHNRKQYKRRRPKK